jgi:pimeloyl-ACP methyl ester carboxylesterase
MGDLRSAYRFVTPTLVASGYTVVTTDLRGHGDSDNSFSAYGDAPTAEDLAALLTQLGPAVVVGNSMAAAAAVVVAAVHPELVRGLVLIGPFVRQPASSTPLNRLLLRLLMARPWAAAAWRAYMPKLYGGTRPVDFSAYRDEVIRSIRRPGYTRAFSRTKRTGHDQAEKALAQVNAPVLVVMGESDPDFPDPSAEAEWIARIVTGRIEMIADAGHYPQSQQPEQVGRVIAEFLLEVTDHA